MNPYVKNRILFISVILFGFVLYGQLFIEEAKSCIGSPKILPTIFIGFPIVFLLLFIDSVITFLSKKHRKYIVYPFLYYFAVALLILLIFRDC